MRVLVQRVTRARVTVNGEETGAIGPGLLLFAGISGGDGVEEVDFLAAKVANLRIFNDPSGKMNWSALDVMREVDAGTQPPVAVLVVSQFTLYGDMRKGRRPSFVQAARPEQAEPLVAALGHALRAYSVPVAEGRFGAEMQVELVNDGPVTLWLDSNELRR